MAKSSFRVGKLTMIKNIILLVLILICFNVNAQKIINDWKGSNKQTTLNHYIENNVYDSLNFNPIEKDTLNDIKTKTLKTKSNSNVIIRYHSAIPETPLIIINEFATDNNDIWNSIQLKYLKKVTLIKPNEIISAIYGSRGQKGVLLVKMNKRKWKAIKNKYKKELKKPSRF